MATLISDLDYEAALTRGKAELMQPHVVAATFDQAARKITLIFSNGLECALRPEISDFLRDHADADLSNPYVTPGGDGLIFEAANLSVSIPGLLAQLLPEDVARKRVASAMGSSKSERKAEAARANGARGGRPKRTSAEAVSERVATPDAMAPTDLWSYHQIAKQISRAEEHLLQRGIKLHAQSTLAAIFRQGARLSEDWDAGLRGESTAARVVEAAFAMRISHAVLALTAADAASELLKRVSKKSVHPSLPGPSQGKDALWELELLARLRAQGVRTWLGEPDILVDLDGVPYPIACKKIYRVARFEDAVRAGVSQLDEFGGIGLVAVNVDELLPTPGPIYAAKTAKNLAERLALFLSSPPDSARAFMQRIVTERRCDGVLLSATVLSHLEEGRAGLNIQTQYAIFNLGANDLQYRRVAALAKFFAPPHQKEHN